MLSKIRLQLRTAGQSIAGDAMLPRLRNASIALVGAVAAVGLALTVFISQLGFPAVVSGPIPGPPSKAGSVHDAVALTQSGTAGISASAARVSPAAVAPAHNARTGGHAGGRRESGGGDGSQQVSVSPGVAHAPAPHQIAPSPAPTPSPVESSPPAPVPVAVAESPPVTGVAGVAKGVSDGKAKPSGPSTAKVTTDESGKSGTSSAGTKDHQVSKSDGHTASSEKAKSSPAEKAGNDQKSATPAAPAPPAKTEPATTSPAAAKEAADSGR